MKIGIPFSERQVKELLGIGPKLSALMKPTCGRFVNFAIPEVARAPAFNGPITFGWILLTPSSQNLTPNADQRR